MGAPEPPTRLSEQTLEALGAALADAEAILAKPLQDTILRLRHGVRHDPPETLLASLLSDLPPWAATQGFDPVVVRTALEQLVAIPDLDARNTEAFRIWAYLVVHAAHQ